MQKILSKINIESQIYSVDPIPETFKIFDLEASTRGSGVGLSGGNGGAVGAPGSGATGSGNNTGLLLGVGGSLRPRRSIVATVLPAPGSGKKVYPDGTYSITSQRGDIYYFDANGNPTWTVWDGAAPSGPIQVGLAGGESGGKTGAAQVYSVNIQNQDIVNQSQPSSNVDPIGWQQRFDDVREKIKRLRTKVAESFPG